MKMFHFAYEQTWQWRTQDSHRPLGAGQNIRISCEFFRPGSLLADRKQYSVSGSNMANNFRGVGEWLPAPLTTLDVLLYMQACGMVKSVKQWTGSARLSAALNHPNTSPIAIWIAELPGTRFLLCWVGLIAKILWHVQRAWIWIWNISASLNGRG